MTASLRAAMAPGRSADTDIVLLGIEPDHADPELGYIVPGRAGHAGFRTVSRFVEKPSAAEANELIREGALWNAFIIAADASALLQLFERRCPEVVAKLRRVIELEPKDDCRSEALAGLYDELQDLDFSRGILQGQEKYLRVLAVPECGWSDLGTPERVAAALREIEDCPPAPKAPRQSWASISLRQQAFNLRGSQSLGV